ncbi:electron transfer flavoprotein subunit alpha/FixB family protein [bacterium]|nr:electron transfer flavoprotein subunit alpha/FixB family protein [bacterium]
MSKKILIYIEKQNSVSEELAKKAQELLQNFDDAEIAGIAINAGLDLGSKTYFDKIYYVNDSRLENYSGEYYSKISIDLITEINPDIVLIGATSLGRDLAPQIASALQTGLTADCTALDINEDGKLAATRPTFGGKLMATILSKNNPQMATVRPHVIVTDFDVQLKDTEYIEIKPQIDDIKTHVKLLETIKKEISAGIEDAEIIVAGGHGVKDNLDLVYQLAEKLNGKVGVSRAVVDLGLAEASIQIGQTGKTVSPKLYIAIGISGAMQHTVGIMGAKKIIAINKDKDAPIFKLADFGIVGDALEILPQLIKSL